jgi:hypothetical protein
MSHLINDIDKLEQARGKEVMGFGVDGDTNQFNIIDVDAQGRTASRQYIWDTTTLSWVAGNSAGGAVGGGGGSDVAYAEITTINNGYAYSAKAPVGSASSSAVWQVNRTSLSDPFITTWADGNINFDNRADAMPSLTYL